MSKSDAARPFENTGHIAFLSADSSDQAIAHALVGLANNGGGAIVLGLTKTGKPQKSFQPTTLPDRLMRIALEIAPPLIVPTPVLKRHNRHPYLWMNIPPDLPHVYHYKGRYLIWQDKSLKPLAGAALRRLIFTRGEASFEGLPLSEARLDDLNPDATASYTRRVKGLRHLSPEDALLKRGGLKPDPDGTLHPTHAGLLLFGKDPQKWLPQAEITVARYTGMQMTDAFSRADIKGTLPEQARQTEAFVLENISKNVHIDALQRDEKYLYPPTAVREVIVNALAHRDYSIRGDQIRLLLFANRLECYSPGRLPGHITVDNILQERFSRNAAIVQVLFDMGFIERLGYGIDRIVRSLTENQLPPPKFEETPAGFKLTLYNRLQVESSQSPDTMRRWLEMGLNERQISALMHLARQGRITNADYQTLCPDVSPETLRRDLASLVNRDILLRIGEKRATFYILK